MTSNIRYENINDGIHNWPHRIEFLSFLINRENPLILGTQEGRYPQILELAAKLDNLSLVESHRDWIKERMYPCLFINKNEIEVLDSGDVWLSETPHVSESKSFNSLFPRLFTWAKINIIKESKRYFVINTHLDHIYAETRIEQSKVLVSEALKISNGLPIILIGDFNESPISKIHNQFISELKLVDHWFQKNRFEETSHHGFGGIETIEGHRIDWILVPQEIDCTEIKMIKEKNDKGIYPSDHYPLVFIGNTHS